MPVIRSGSGGSDLGRAGRITAASLSQRKTPNLPKPSVNRHAFSGYLTTSRHRRFAVASPQAGRKCLAAATAEVEQESNRAREELRGQVSAIAVASAEKILRREIDAEAHEDILSKLAAEL